jgi:hypothetical protein
VRQAIETTGTSLMYLPALLGELQPHRDGAPEPDHRAADPRLLGSNPHRFSTPLPRADAKIIQTPMLKTLESLWSWSKLLMHSRFLMRFALFI